MENDIGIIVRSDERSPESQGSVSPKKCCGCSRNKEPVCFPSNNFFILADSSKDGYFIVDEHFKILFINLTLKEWTGEHGAKPNQTVFSLINPSDCPSYISCCHSILCGQTKTSSLSIRFLKQNGCYQPVSLHMENIIYNNQPVVLNIIRCKSRSSLEKTIYQKIVDSYPEMALVLDKNGNNVLAVNSHLIEKMGKSYKEIVRGGIFSCIPEDMVFERRKMLETAISTGKPVSFTDCDKDHCTMEHFISPIKNTNGDIENIVIFCRDISHHIEAEESNRMLLRRLLSATEEERKKIAYELHDECGQLAMVVSLGLASIRKTLPDNMDHLKCLCDRYLAIIERLSNVIKNMSSELHPDLIDHFGLIPAISWYLETFFAGTHSVAHMFKCNLTEKSFGPKIDIVLYRVIQESLNNVIRHAHAKNVFIDLKKTGDQLKMIIQDDGVGFENHDNEPARAGRRLGIGLLSMKERVTELNGRFVIETAPQCGTKIIVDILIPQDGIMNENL